MKKYINIEDIRITGNTMLDDENNIYVSLSDVSNAVIQTPSADVRENIKAEWIKTRYKKCLYARIVVNAHRQLKRSFVLIVGR